MATISYMPSRKTAWHDATESPIPFPAADNAFDIKTGLYECKLEIHVIAWH